MEPGYQLIEPARWLKHDHTQASPPLSHATTNWKDWQPVSAMPVIQPIESCALVADPRPTPASITDDDRSWRRKRR